MKWHLPLSHEGGLRSRRACGGRDIDGCEDVGKFFEMQNAKYDGKWDLVIFVGNKKPTLFSSRSFLSEQHFWAMRPSKKLNER